MSLTLLYELILSKRVSNSLWESEVLLFDFINKAFILVFQPY